MEKKKLTMIIGAGAAALIVVIVAAVWFLNGGSSSGGSKDDKVYVENVGNLISINQGAVSSYSGKVESQDTWGVKKDMSKEISEMLVSVGDKVEEGTPLFVYDTDDISSQIDQAYLDLEGIGNEIDGYYEQIESLENSLADVTDPKIKLGYETELGQARTALRQAEFNQTQKQSEISKLQKSIENATVTSKIGGVVKEINESGTDAYGSEKDCITILATGDYRIKASVDEQSFYYSGLSVGQEVLVRSRVDENQTWQGIISEINTEGEAQSDNNGYYYGQSSGESATKYPFYVKLNSSEGLILGQHVFIEPDYGQTEKKEGIWLDASYVVMEEDKTYIWAANSKNKIEKRTVELGEFDANTNTYQILSGITEEDYIAWPMPGMYEGIKTVTDMAEVDYNSPLYQQGNEGEEGTEMPIDENMIPEEGAVDPDAAEVSE